MKKFKKFIKTKHRAAVAAIISVAGAVYIVPGASADGEGMGQITAAFDNIGTIIQGIATGIGGVLLVWNVIQFASALQSHDASQRNQALLGIAGAVICIAAGTIAKAIIGG